jgi:hypothetical protein
MVAAASDLGACVCEDDATVSACPNCERQAEQIAALQEALKVARADVEKLMFEHRGSMLRMGGSYALSRIDVALALAEGCAAPAPGMTDLMVTPESIDAYLAENPPPPAPAPEEEK